MSRARWTPEDRWLRVHVRHGAQIVRIAPFAMIVVEALDRWRAWTGQPFDVSGPVAVRGGLAPVVCDLDRDVGVYVEPNVWVRHRCGEVRTGALGPYQTVGARTGFRAEM